MAEHMPRKLVMLGWGSICSIVASSDSKSFLSERLALAMHYMKPQS